MDFSSNIAKLLYDDLHSRYKNATISKKDLAKEMNISMSTLDNYMALGIGIPEYIKLGEGKNARVIFTIVSVAEYLASKTTKTV